MQYDFIILFKIVITESLVTIRKHKYTWVLTSHTIHCICVNECVLLGNKISAQAMRSESEITTPATLHCIAASLETLIILRRRQVMPVIDDSTWLNNMDNRDYYALFHLFREKKCVNVYRIYQK